MVYYLILGSNESEQVEIVSLVNRLSCPDVKFLIHIDRKFNIINSLQELTARNVQILEDRIVCNWSGFSLVEAMLLLLERAKKTQEKAVYQFLSPKCFPLREAEICARYLEHTGTNIHFWGVIEPKKTKHEHLSQRFVKNIWLFDLKPLNFRNYKGSISSYLVQNFVRGLHLILSLLITVNKGHAFLKGSQWFSIRSDDWHSVSQRDIANLKKKLRFTKAPDEIFFHTLLSNFYTPDKKVSSKHNTYANHYIDWSNPKSGPKLFTVEQSQKIQTDAIFIRKILI